MASAVWWAALGFVLVAWWAVLRAAERAWWRPRRLERALRAQGLRGTRYRPPYGDQGDEARLSSEARARPIPLSHAILPRVAPFLYRTSHDHGKISFTWFGPYPRLSIRDPELIREVLSNKPGHFEKPRITNPLLRLLATGLAIYEGEKWAKHRRIITPAFHMEKLKLMLPAVSVCCDELVKKWETIAGPEGSNELDVWPEFRRFTGDVISRTAFGSSYEEGQRIFELQNEQAELFLQAAQSIYIPGYRFIPTKKNLRMKEISREVRAIVRNMIEERENIRNKGSSADDLLGLLMESNLGDLKEQGNSINNRMTMDEVIEECKLFYLAGHETSSVLLTWTMIVLSMHPNWQTSAREEVQQIFGNKKPDFDGLSRLKIVTMILHEVLRLYPPAINLIRKTYKEAKLGEFTIPPGVELWLPILFIHHDPEFWGEDADEFKPERFSEGVSKASKNQIAFFPFGWGPRTCIGQSFAMLEAKMALATILQRFSFKLSPSYAHAPHTVLHLQPQHGAQLILHKIEQLS